MNIEWKDGAVCKAGDMYWYPSNSNKLRSCAGAVEVSLDTAAENPAFQLNEIRIGDYIEKSELDTEQKYNDVVEVFGLFGALFDESAVKEYQGFKNSNSLCFCKDGLWQVYPASTSTKRKLTYNQVMAVGKLKRIINEKSAPKSAPKVSADNIKVTNNKYEREISDRQGNNAIVDVYDVLKAFNVTCPATQHAVKKLLCSGIRGHKDLATDLVEAKESIARAIELSE